MKSEAVVTECPFCPIQLQDILNQLGYSHIKVLNVPDLLATSYKQGAES